jgi:hypothetical protein
MLEVLMEGPLSWDLASTHPDKTNINVFYNSRKEHIQRTCLGLQTALLDICTRQICACIGLENRDHGRRWYAVLLPQNLALTSSKSGGRSVAIVRSRTQTTDFLMCVCVCLSGILHKYMFIVLGISPKKDNAATEKATAVPTSVPQSAAKPATTAPSHTTHVSSPTTTGNVTKIPASSTHATVAETTTPTTVPTSTANPATTAPTPPQNVSSTTNATSLPGEIPLESYAAAVAATASVCVTVAALVACLWDGPTNVLFKLNAVIMSKEPKTKR